MKPTRRTVLTQGSAAGAAVALGPLACAGEDKGEVGGTGLEETPTRGEEPEAWEPEGTEDDEVFSTGVQVGDVLSDGAIVSVWCEAEAVSLTWAVADGDTWVEVGRQEDLTPDGRGVVQIELTGLESDTAYSVVASTDGGLRSRASRFRTALGSDDWRVVIFAATSCMGGNEPWPNLTAVSAERPDFMCLLGDSIYADSMSPAFQYWTLWRRHLGHDGLRDMSANTSFIATWDDHEVDNNWSWTETSDIEQKYADGIAAFRDALPQREGPGGSGIWRVLRWGPVLDVFVLDCRGERRDDLYISTEQMDWLKEELSASSARFKIILNSVPITDLTAIFGIIAYEDRWQGFPVQREEILAHIAESGIEGVLWVAGDLHYASANKIDPVGGTAAEAWEVMAGPSGSILNIGAGLFAGDEQFPVIFDAWNCTRFECDPGTGTVHVSWVGDDGSVLDEIVLEL